MTKTTTKTPSGAQAAPSTPTGAGAAATASTSTDVSSRSREVEVEPMAVDTAEATQAGPGETHSAPSQMILTPEALTTAFLQLLKAIPAFSSQMDENSISAVIAAASGVFGAQISTEAVMAKVLPSCPVRRNV
jgi:hypothetical protein